MIDGRGATNDRPSASHGAPMKKCRAHSTAIVLATSLLVSAAPGRADDVPRLETNQAYVEEAARATSLDVANPIAVFAFVINSLPERVKVYPTENYFYFRFLHNGVYYAGNVRLDAADR